METNDVMSQENKFPSTPEIAFLTKGSTGGHAYYVLTHLQRYGNTILNNAVIERYGLEDTKRAIESLIGSQVNIRQVPATERDSGFYVVELVNDAQRAHLRIPPALDAETIQSNKDFLTYIVIGSDSRAEKTLYALLNGEDDTYACTMSVYRIAFSKKGVYMKNASNGQIVVFTLAEIKKALLKEDIFCED